jgi:hypothetical protein
MKSSIVKLDLQRIVQYVAKRGCGTLIDGDCVVVLRRTVPCMFDGVPYISFRCDRVTSMADAKVLFQRSRTRRPELQAA